MDCRYNRPWVQETFSPFGFQAVRQKPCVCVYDGRGRFSYYGSYASGCENY